MNHETRLAKVRRVGIALGAGLLACGVLAIVGVPTASAKASAPQVLYVGAVNGVTTPAASTFATIQAAVTAAKKGDWILIAPGDYHESGDTGYGAPTTTQLSEGYYGGVIITTPDLHLRGLDRNSVIVDGTSAGASTCSSAPGGQNSLNGEGRNGIVIWKANGVSVENLTVCNFIAGSGSSGNEIWWNGGAGSGKVGLKGYTGNYLTATSTYFVNDASDADICSTCAQYGIFASNSRNGTWNQLYANNFADSGMYVGACHRVCNVTIQNAQMEDNALGYSGTNSGGQVVIENSIFDNNKEGVDTNTALTGDPPPPQDGRCSGKSLSSITHTNSCWVFIDNLVENNNNPNVPVVGTAGLGPTGTGMTISGGRNDTVMDNEFLGNGAWGILFVPYPDGNTTSDGKTCKATGGEVASGLGVAGVACLYDPEGDALLNNKFSGNGTLGNPTNADFGNLLVGGKTPENCFSGNTEWNSGFTLETGPATSADSALTPSTCGAKTPKTTLLGVNTDATLLLQAECDSGVLACSGSGYPQATSVVMHPIPAGLPSMPNPCTGVPSNAWCRGGVPVAGPRR
ncbi:MAG TPA: right-handed parallel beta-helix repeat-containing protein [Acidimicrobiales bacterium]|nr:right-handed parallel beta-helix repeat-containing protein [Acidimicrobiales bacterium]